MDSTETTERPAAKAGKGADVLQAWDSQAAQGLRETKFVREALKLAEVILTADHPIGELVGPAGTGKTCAGRAVAQKYRAQRIVAWEGMTRHQLAAEVAQALGLEGAGAGQRLLATRIAPMDGPRQLVVVDEANKLNWRGLEVLRYLADECNLAVLLIGTELYDRQFTNSRTRELLDQLGSRIGAKRAATRHMDRAETYVHVFRPFFGDSEDRELVTRFWEGSRRGNFREARELAAECRRIMAANAMQTLTSAVLELALKWMANRRPVLGSGGRAAPAGEGA
jgi:DNA transposition AAA+ family ATPase